MIVPAEAGTFFSPLIAMHSLWISTIVFQDMTTTPHFYVRSQSRGFTTSSFAAGHAALRVRHF